MCFRPGPAVDLTRDPSEIRQRLRRLLAEEEFLRIGGVGLQRGAVQARIRLGLYVLDARPQLLDQRVRHAFHNGLEKKGVAVTITCRSKDCVHARTTYVRMC